jgi:hypothetical protein
MLCCCVPVPVPVCVCVCVCECVCRCVPVCVCVVPDRRRQAHRGTYAKVALGDIAALDQRVLRVLWRGQVHFRAKKQVIRGHIWG